MLYTALTLHTYIDTHIHTRRVLYLHTDLREGFPSRLLVMWVAF